MGVIVFPFGSRTYQIADECETVPLVILPERVIVRLSRIDEEADEQQRRNAQVELVHELSPADLIADLRAYLDNGLATLAVDITQLAWTPFARVSDPRGLEAYANTMYHVIIRRQSGGPGWPELIHLSIARLDKSASFPWRELQRIKNELVGSQAQGHEFYPPEDQLVDTANQRHLFVFPFPVLGWGFEDRVVGDGSTVDHRVAQDDLPEPLQPADWLTGEQLEQRLQMLDARA